MQFTLVLIIVSLIASAFSDPVSTLGHNNVTNDTVVVNSFEVVSAGDSQALPKPTIISLRSRAHDQVVRQTVGLALALFTAVRPSLDPVTRTIQRPSVVGHFTAVYLRSSSHYLDLDALHHTWSQVSSGARYLTNLLRRWFSRSQLPQREPPRDTCPMPALGSCMVGTEQFDRPARPQPSPPARITLQSCVVIVVEGVVVGLLLIACLLLELLGFMLRSTPELLARQVFQDPSVPMWFCDYVFGPECTGPTCSGSNPARVLSPSDRKTLGVVVFQPTPALSSCDLVTQPEAIIVCKSADDIESTTGPKPEPADAVQADQDHEVRSKSTSSPPEPTSDGPEANVVSSVTNPVDEAPSGSTEPSSDTAPVSNHTVLEANTDTNNPKPALNSTPPTSQEPVIESQSEYQSSGEERNPDLPANNHPPSPANTTSTPPAETVPAPPANTIPSLPPRDDTGLSANNDSTLPANGAPISPAKVDLSLPIGGNTLNVQTGEDHKLRADSNPKTPSQQPPRKNLSIQGWLARRALNPKSTAKPKIPETERNVQVEQVPKDSEVNTASQLAFSSKVESLSGESHVETQPDQLELQLERRNSDAGHPADVGSALISHTEPQPEPQAVPTEPTVITDSRHGEDEAKSESQAVSAVKSLRSSPSQAAPTTVPEAPTGQESASNTALDLIPSRPRSPILVGPVVTSDVVISPQPESSATTSSESPIDTVDQSDSITPTSGFKSDSLPTTPAASEIDNLTVNNGDHALPSGNKSRARHSHDDLLARQRLFDSIFDLPKHEPLEDTAMSPSELASTSVIMPDAENGGGKGPSDDSEMSEARSNIPAETANDGSSHNPNEQPPHHEDRSIEVEDRLTSPDLASTRGVPHPVEDEKMSSDEEPAFDEVMSHDEYSSPDETMSPNESTAPGQEISTNQDMLLGEEVLVDQSVSPGESLPDQEMNAEESTNPVDRSETFHQASIGHTYSEYQSSIIQTGLPTVSMAAPQDPAGQRAIGNAPLVQTWTGPPLPIPSPQIPILGIPRALRTPTPPASLESQSAIIQNPNLADEPQWSSSPKYNEIMQQHNKSLAQIELVNSLDDFDVPGWGSDDDSTPPRSMNTLTDPTAPVVEPDNGATAYVDPNEQLVQSESGSSTEFPESSNDYDDDPELDWSGDDEDSLYDWKDSSSETHDPDEQGSLSPVIEYQAPEWMNQYVQQSRYPATHLRTPEAGPVANDAQVVDGESLPDIGSSSSNAQLAVYQNYTRGADGRPIARMPRQRSLAGISASLTSGSAVESQVEVEGQPGTYGTQVTDDQDLNQRSAGRPSYEYSSSDEELTLRQRRDHEDQGSLSDGVGGTSNDDTTGHVDHQCQPESVAPPLVPVPTPASPTLSVVNEEPTERTSSLAGHASDSDSAGSSTSEIPTLSQSVPPTPVHGAPSSPTMPSLPSTSLASDPPTYTSATPPDSVATPLSESEQDQTQKANVCNKRKIKEVDDEESVRDTRRCIRPVSHTRGTSHESTEETQ